MQKLSNMNENSGEDVKGLKKKDASKDKSSLPSNVKSDEIQQTTSDEIPLRIEYSIIPSTPTTFVDMMFLFLFFILFIIYIIYLAAYDTGYKPNFVMFFNFLFDDYDTKSFKLYIQNIMGDFTKKEHFTSLRAENFVSKMIDGFYQQLSYFFVAGNKIKIKKSL